MQNICSPEMMDFDGYEILLARRRSRYGATVGPKETSVRQAEGSLIGYGHTKRGNAMSNNPTQNSAAAMEGGGFYNRHSAMQATGIAALLSLWEAACRTVHIGQGPVTIVDYGSSQGRNSMAPMRIAINRLRDRLGPSIPIEIVHTDLH
jgi:hypothetical protein